MMKDINQNIELGSRIETIIIRIAKCINDITWCIDNDINYSTSITLYSVKFSTLTLNHDSRNPQTKGTISL